MVTFVLLAVLALVPASRDLRLFSTSIATIFPFKNPALKPYIIRRKTKFQIMTPHLRFYWGR